MFAKIFFGITMIITGVSHLLNKRLFLRKDIESLVDDVRSYQKGAGLSYFLLGLLFIVMGVVEKKITETPSFAMIYIILAIIPLTILLVNNKKHAGRYWLYDNKRIKYIEWIGIGIAFISFFVALGLISYFGIFS